MSLHDDILSLPMRRNLPADIQNDVERRVVFKEGFRQARELAAELASKADERIAELEARVEELARRTPPQASAEQGGDLPNCPACDFRRRMGITLLDARWLDPACHQGCQSLVLKKRVEELEIAHLRYEKVRRLNPRQFATLLQTTLNDSGWAFDELVDAIRDPNTAEAPIPKPNP